MQALFVGRQPIYNRDLEVYAYELLYRGGDVDFADFTEGDRATSQVLQNTFTEIGLERVVGDQLSFVNLTRGFVTGEYPLPVPHERVVLEILEDIEPDAEVLKGIRGLKRRGFKIALDDFLFEEWKRPLMALADIIKVDVLDLDGDEIRRQVEPLLEFDCELLAEKIETQEQYDICVEIGFEYFQGYFLSRPSVVQGTTVATNRLTLLRLLAELQDPACDVHQVQELISQDVTLSYKLLRHINAAIYGMPRRVESIEETVVYLGLKTVRNLASLFMLSSIDDKPHDLIVTSMLRARMCELLAAAADQDERGSYFTVGLFSTLDALLDVPIETALERLPLSDELADAIVKRAGRRGEALSCAIAYERGDWDRVACFGLSSGAIKNAFLQSVEWVDVIDSEISGMAA